MPRLAIPLWGGDNLIMNRLQTARATLRNGTAADHHAVDEAFSSYDLTNTAGYGDFLIAQASAFLPVEAAIDRSGPNRVMQDWTCRRRSAFLRTDLSMLNRSIPDAIELPPFDTEAAILGAIYVLEGSRLGGRMLARDVPDEMPKFFLSASNPALWRSLLSELEKQLVTDAQRATAVAAARTVFALFEKGARCRLNPPN